MSTRALVGFMPKDGEDEVTLAWQWNDGDNLKEYLKTEFNSPEQVQELVDIGMYGSLITEEDAEYFSKHPLIDGKVVKLKKTPNMYVTLHNYHKGEKAVTYDNVEEAAGQDVNYVFLYDTFNNCWYYTDTYKEGMTIDDFKQLR